MGVKSSLIYSIKVNSSCKECAAKTLKKRFSGSGNPMFGKNPPNKVVPMTQEQKNKISKIRIERGVAKGEKNPMFGVGLFGNKNGMFGRNHIEKTKELIRIKATGRKVLEKSRRKNRETKLNLIKQRGWLKINPAACEFIDKLNRERGWNLQHDKNGGEYSFCGYSVDGYDKEKNIIFEYDEPYHNSLKRKTKDMIRQKIIIEEVKPNLFIRYDEKNKKLYDVISQKELI